MTIQESTICSLVQAFPILLILAQNHNRCLKTPLIYKPPTPTPSPEYYEALDALFQNLFGHGYHEHDHSGCPYGHGTYVYGKKFSNYGYGHSSPCHSYGYPSTGHSYGHGYGHGSTGISYGSHVIPSTTYHGFGGYPNFAFKKVNMYNVSGTHGYKGTYAPTQVYSTNHKYKVIVKRNKNRAQKRKPQKLVNGQFNQRENRRYPPPEYGFQNFLSNAQEQLTSILNFRPHNRPNMAIYSINNRPIANDQYYYDQYGRPMYRPQYPQYPQRYPERPYEVYPQPNMVWNNNYDSTNFNGVNFPQEYSPITDPPNTVNKENFEGRDFPTERPVQSAVPMDTSSQTIEPITTNLPPLSPVSPNDYQPIFTSRPIDTSEISELAPLTPVNSFDGPAFSGFKPAIPATSELPPFLPTTNTNTELTPLKPVENNPSVSAFELPGTTVSEFSTSVPESKPEIPATSELPPLSPAQDSSQDTPYFKPIPTTIPDYKPESPATSELPPLSASSDPDRSSTFKPAAGGTYSTSEGKPSESLPGFTLGGPSSDLPPLTPVPTLPTLTPVPASESRDSFNFSPIRVFSEPCEVEGRRGSCVPLTSCDPYLAMLQQAKSNPAVAQFLRKVHCGFEGNTPKVCCPTPGIPDQPPPSPDASTTTTTTTTTEPVSSAAITDESEEFIPELPQPPSCGISNATFSRVVGGIPAKLGDFPWMALLGYKRNRGGTGWLCGGTLVSSKHILTAAHCIHGQEQKLYVVRLGELDLAREDEGATPVDILVKKMIKHEEYSGNSYVNDIGVLLLQREVQFTDLIRPICIPKHPELRANTFENYNPIIAGWGALEFRGPSATILQVLQLPVTGNAFCQQAYKAYAANVIDDRVICAGYKKGGKDACQGDSGGPLMQPIWNSQELTIYFYQIGVVSYGKKCAEPGFPGVYTRITTFVPWLEEKILGRRES